MSDLREPVTKAGDNLLTDLIQDHGGVAYSVIERVRIGIVEIEDEMKRRSYNRSLDEALNSGDGTYRP